MEADRRWEREAMRRRLGETEAVAEVPMVATDEPGADAAGTAGAAESKGRRRPSQARARSRGPGTLYERIGGAPALRRLVRRFHEVLANAPEAAEARAVLHGTPADLGPKLFAFFSGWLGGPDLYGERHGAPKLKRRHFLVPIGEAQAMAWLFAFRTACEETIEDRAVVAELVPQVESLALYLVNRG